MPTNTEPNALSVDSLDGDEIEFVFEPAGDDDTPVNALAFSEYLAALVLALRHTAEFIVGQQHLPVEYDIVQVSLNSPLTVKMRRTGAAEADPVLLTRAENFFTSAVTTIQQGGDIPPQLDSRTLRSYLRVGEAARRSRLAVAVRTRDARTVVRPRLSDRLEVVLQGDIEVDGSIEGHLSFLNVRGRPVIKIYPTVGPYVTGRVPRNLVPKAKHAVDEYVVVEGTLIYRPNESHPYRIRVRDIVQMETAGVGSFEELWGVGRGYEPGKSSLDLIEEMRSGWE